MAVGWFIAAYKRRVPAPFNGFVRYCPVDDFTGQVLADGGDWREIETPGGFCLVKVRASPATLSTVAAAPGIQQLPAAALNASLGSLSAGAKTAIVNKVTSSPPAGMGIPLATLQAALGADIGTHTLGDVLRFCAQTRAAGGIRYVAGNDTVVYDQPFTQAMTPDLVEFLV